jgi:holo-[acyl-carrier protein] synthase
MVGIDLCEVARIQRAVERHGGRFLRRIFAAREIRLCRGLPVQHLAARFAAKEAFAKAVRARRVPWRDVVVTTPPGTAPDLELRGDALRAARKLGASGAIVSLAHDGGIAAAVVMLTGFDRDRGREAARRGRLR